MEKESSEKGTKIARNEKKKNKNL
uniref:Uncharacterized protein n=1 Tax=Rhizophora mucronata TaxID=61149 RepID=A0A2P2PDV9_RHIMU